MCVALVTCVAVALSLSACVFPFNGGALEPTPEPPAHSVPSDAYDEWVYWTADPKDELLAEQNENLLVISEVLALDVVFEQPAQPYTDDGWYGVAQYGSLCIIALGLDEQSREDGSVALMILSRYDTSLTVFTTWSSDYEAIRTDIQPFTDWCEEGGPLPEPTDSGVPPLEEPTTDA
jgi:hypothetical protein